MRFQKQAGAILLAGLLAGSGYAMSLGVRPQQNQQNANGQQPGQDKEKDKDKKKKKDQPGGNSTDQNNNPSGGTPTPPPPAGNKPPGGDKPTPLFGGTIGLKSSRQTKDSATLGFNGVDPNGQVAKNFLSAAATPADAMRAQQVAQTTVSPADLVQFLQDGGLNPTAAPQKP